MNIFNCKTCEHTKASHIYEEGPCRPGFVCASECEAFVSQTPALDKIKAERPRTQVLGEFIDWLESKGIHLCDYIEGVERYYPTSESTESLIAEFAGVDLNAAETERRALLAEIQGG